MEFLREWMMAWVRAIAFPIVRWWEREPSESNLFQLNPDFEFCEDCWASGCNTYCARCLIKQEQSFARGEIKQDG